MDQRPVHRVQRYIAADRRDLHMPIAHIGQSHRTVQRLDVNMPGTNIAHVDDRRTTFHNHVAMELFHVQGPGRRMQSHARIRRHEDFVLDTSRVRVCPIQKMGENRDPILPIALVNLDFPRGQESP